MKTRTAPIALLAAALVLSINALSFADDLLGDVKVALKVEGVPQAEIESVQGHVYSFADQGDEAPIALRNGAMTATLSLPVSGQDPINLQAAALIKIKGTDAPCKFTAERDFLPTPDQGVVVMRGVCS